MKVHQLDPGVGYSTIISRMAFDQFKPVANDIHAALDAFDIEHELDAIDVEREWVDFRVEVPDGRQMERINTWLQDDIKAHIHGWSDIQIDAPTPVAGKENELRIRIYVNNEDLG